MPEPAPPALAGHDPHARRGAALAFAVAFGSALTATLWSASFVPAVASGGAPSVAFDWVPRLGVELAFRLDGLAMLFCLLIAGIGTLVIAYSFAYFKGHPDHARLHWLLLAFMVSMLGLVLADNVLLLFVFWELTTITSFLLVGFDHANAKARRSALQALLITGGGGLALLVGMVLLAEAAGSYRLSAIVAGGSLADHALYLPILALVLVGAFTKSAQFPFHFWLPNAMAAPSPVSAYLHSATMVKAGIYLMARVQPTLGGTDTWFLTLTSIGALTAVWASLMALRQSDIKLMLAWTTVMALGTLTMFLGSDVRIAALAAVTFLIVHAFYKCALFLVIGNVDKRTGTRELGRLGGLVRPMPVTAAVALLAGFSMAGFPPFLGFIGKELKYEGALAISEEPWLVVAAAVAANAMMVAVALTIVFRVFLSGRSDTPKTPGEVPFAMWAGPALLAIAGLLTGIFPDLVATTIITPAMNQVLGAETRDAYLSLWHGINVPLVLSVVTVAIGTALFFRLAAVRGALEHAVARLPASGDRVYAALLDGTSAFARQSTDRLQNGSLSRYLGIVFVVLVTAVGAALIGSGASIRIDAATPVTAVVAVVAILIALATFVVTVTKSRLLAICMLGIVGSGLALMFLILGAIDVAITQLMVETLFVVMVAAVLPRLPYFSGNAHPGRAGTLRDATIAITAGLVTALVAVGVAGTPTDLAVTRFYETASLSEAYGRNIVNVILVDFRAMDTFGEVVVVAIAAMAIIAFLKVRPQDPHRRGGRS